MLYYMLSLITLCYIMLCYSISSQSQFVGNPRAVPDLGFDACELGSQASNLGGSIFVSAAACMGAPLSWTVLCGDSGVILVMIINILLLLLLLLLLLVIIMMIIIIITMIIMVVIIVILVRLILIVILLIIVMIMVCKFVRVSGLPWCHLLLHYVAPWLQSRSQPQTLHCK